MPGLFTVLDRPVHDLALRPFHTLALCAGAGGLELGVELAVPHARCVAYVEREAYAAGTLVARMEAGELAPAPVWSDLATFDARPWRGRIHCVTSGDPCQDNSVAGRGLGADGDRFLAPEVVRIADECRPDRIFRENVTGNADGQLAAIVPALERLGYRVAAGIFSAAGVGASHRRERMFIMADRDGARWAAPRSGRLLDPRGQPLARSGNVGDAKSGRRHGPSAGGGQARPIADRGSSGELVDPPRIGRGEGRPEHELWSGRGAAANPGGALADADDGGRRRQGHRSIVSGAIMHNGGGMAIPTLAPGPADSRWRQIIARAPHLEPAVRRMADGLANRVDRLRLCGNGVHPLAAGYAYLALDALLAEDAGSRAAVIAA